MANILTRIISIFKRKKKVEKEPVKKGPLYAYRTRVLPDED